MEPHCRATTDDSEIALLLARELDELDGYDQETVENGYIDGLKSGPFDCGQTIYNGLVGSHLSESQTNGALMRISPLSIYGVNHLLEKVRDLGHQGY